MTRRLHTRWNAAYLLVRALFLLLAGAAMRIGLIAGLFAYVAANDRTPDALLNAVSGLSAAFLVANRSFPIPRREGMRLRPIAHACNQALWLEPRRLTVA